MIFFYTSFISYTPWLLCLFFLKLYSLYPLFYKIPETAHVCHPVKKFLSLKLFYWTSIADETAQQTVYTTGVK